MQTRSFGTTGEVSSCEGPGPSTYNTAAPGNKEKRGLPKKRQKPNPVCGIADEANERLNLIQKGFNFQLHGWPSAFFFLPVSTPARNEGQLCLLHVQPWSLVRWPLSSSSL